MSIIETLFGKVSDWVRASDVKHRSAFTSTFEELYPSLVAYSQGALTADQTPLQLNPHDGFGMIYDYTLLLPREIALFSDLQLNRDLFLHKALAGGILRRLGIESRVNRRCMIQRTLELAWLRPRIMKAANEVFPGYAEWSEELFERHQAALESLDHGSSADAAWLRVEARIGRGVIEAIAEAQLPQELRRIESTLAPELARELDRIPELIMAPWCEPIIAQTLMGGLQDTNQKKRSRSESEDTENEGHAGSEIEVVDLEKERKSENPVTHSFEKLETADEYQGGYKTVDGSDQLDDHMNAVDELDMKKVTRGGEAASSIYKADIADLVKTDSSALESAKKIRHVYYPEWDYQKRQLKPDYCRLYLEKPDPKELGTGEPWLKRALEKQDQNLEQWKHRLSSLINQRRWRDRQWEGSEISIDAFVRYWGDARFSGWGDARLYSKNYPAARDFSCLILIDQSYSTDSWVMNRRVLDVELESLAIISQLLGPLREPVAVAGTWSETRNHCHFKLYKDFDDSWAQLIDHIPSIEPQGYTRLGPAIRHATELLSNQGGKHKLLILLTDGKPTDYDRYEGRYGVEDIHHACLETTQKGVSLRALTIEKEAKNYFPHLFGAREYQILQNPDDLPESLFRIYLETLRG
jgi:nitric oxide reductase NorD protein